MSWFDQNELPQINSPDDLKRAMEIVKSRFNGHPHKYTRNDYILFINTLYAALMASYSGSGGGSESISATLTQDLSVNYPLEVGFVESGKYYYKDTPIEFVLRDILKQDIESIKLDSPEIISSKGDAFLDTTEISITCSKPDISCIYYTLSNDHGWRIYSTPFVVHNTTTITAKAVPTYRAGYKYTESDQNTLSVCKVTKTKLKSPIINQDSDYDKSTISIENQNAGIGTILYSYDKSAWYTYNEDIIKKSSEDQNTRIYAKVQAPSEQYQDSEIKEVTISFKQVPKPKVTIKTGTTTHIYDINATIEYNQDYPQLINCDTGLNNNYEAVVLYNDNDTFELKEEVVIKTRITMADGSSFRYSEVYTITFEQIEDLIVYSNMIDPVDKTYTIYIYDDLGDLVRTENKIVEMNKKFSLTQFTSNFSQSFNDYHKNESGYYVKVQDNQSIEILCNKQLTSENTEIYQIVPNEDGWPISSMQKDNYSRALKPITDKSIDGRKMYSYELDPKEAFVDISSDVLFKITIK